MSKVISEPTFEESLQRCSFCPHLKGRSKVAVIEEMVDALALACGIDRNGVLASILEREALMSTGMQFGVALPHGKHASVPILVTAVGLSPEGIDFDSLDGAPSHIFVMTVSSPERVGPHIRFLAAIGKLMDRPAVRERVLSAADRSMLAKALR